MTITEGVLLGTWVVNSVGVLSGVIVSLRNSRKIDAVHRSTNGMMDQLVQEVRKSSFAEGAKSETDKTA